MSASPPGYSTASWVEADSGEDSFCPCGGPVAGGRCAMCRRSRAEAAEALTVAGGAAGAQFPPGEADLGDPRPSASTTVDATRSDGLYLLAASNVRAERVTWAWAERIPLGALSLLVGMPGLGKSTLTVELAARLSRGDLAGDLRGDPCTVLLATAEDALAQVVVPRLQAAGADLDRVHFVRVARDGLDGGLALPADADALRTEAERVGARLIVVDPLVAHLPGEVDSHRDQDVRRALAPVASLAEELGAAVVGVLHLNKGASSEVLFRVIASIGFVAAARSVLLLGADPKDPDAPTRVLASAKANLGPPAPALRFRVEGRTVGDDIATSGLAWLGEADGVRAADLIASGGSERTERDEAADWLREALVEGPLQPDELIREAAAAGISRRTLRRAKAALRVRSIKVGFGAGWRWALPEDGHEGGQAPEVGPLRPLAAQTLQVTTEDGQPAESGPLRGNLQDGPGPYDDGGLVAGETLKGKEREAPGLVKGELGAVEVSTADHVRTRRTHGADRFTIARELHEAGAPPPPGFASWTAAAVAAVEGMGVT